MPATNEISAKWPSIFELASEIPAMDLNRVTGGDRSKNRPPVTQGLIPAPFPTTEGLHEGVTPAQLASLIVPKIEVNGTIQGFQREKITSHARKIARAILAGREMPPINVSIFPDGKPYLGEGQHRALGAIIAGSTLDAVVKKRTVEQARQLFADQKKARNLKGDDTLLTGDSLIELYIQDAVTTDKHPWSDLVAPAKSDSRMTPTTMARAVGSFVYNSLNQSPGFYITKPEAEWDQHRADLLAKLIRSFGNKQTNPLAFRARSIIAIATAATYIFRRNPALIEGKDIERWGKHMATFDFSKYGHLLLREHDLAAVLVEHWNKRLPEERRVKPYQFG